jgi:hypothetical protein
MPINKLRQKVRADLESPADRRPRTGWLSGSAALVGSVAGLLLVLFPFLDQLFRTHHLPPGQWPAGYGIEGHPVPKSHWRQFLDPFTRKRA